MYDGNAFRSEIEKKEEKLDFDDNNWINYMNYIEWAVNQIQWILRLMEIFWKFWELIDKYRVSTLTTVTIL